MKKTAAVDELPTLQETKPPKLTPAQRQAIREQARARNGHIRPARSEDPRGTADLPWVKPSEYNAATDFLNQLDDPGLAGFIENLEADIKKTGTHVDSRGKIDSGWSDIPTEVVVDSGVVLWLARMILKTRKQLKQVPRG